MNVSLCASLSEDVAGYSNFLVSFFFLFNLTNIPVHCVVQFGLCSSVAVVKYNYMFTLSV